MSCTISGRDVIQHAAEGNCPEGKYAGEPTVQPVERAAPQPVPPTIWPAWANLVAARATPSDIGVGSTIERELGRAGVAFKAVLATLGVPCGCADRRDEWNALYPYHMPANGSSGE